MIIIGNQKCHGYLRSRNIILSQDMVHLILDIVFLDYHHQDYHWQIYHE